MGLVGLVHVNDFIRILEAGDQCGIHEVDLRDTSFQSICGAFYQFGLIMVFRMLVSRIPVRRI